MRWILGLILLALFLWLAQIVELAILPNLQEQLPLWTQPFLHLHLLALAAILTGMLRGEIQGMTLAVVAAGLYALPQSPGHLGASLIGFGLAAFLGGTLARFFRFRGAGFRWLVIFLLLSLETLSIGVIRRMIWEELPWRLSWSLVGGLVLTAVIGSALYASLAPRFRRDFD